MHLMKNYSDVFGAVPIAWERSGYLSSSTGRDFLNCCSFVSSCHAPILHCEMARVSCIRYSKLCFLIMKVSFGCPCFGGFASFVCIILFSLPCVFYDQTCLMELKTLDVKFILIVFPCEIMVKT